MKNKTPSDFEPNFFSMKDPEPVDVENYINQKYFHSEYHTKQNW